MKAKRLVTQNTIAKSMNISISQVSRALSDKGEVSAKTRMQIKEFAEKIGYSPNLIAKSLRLNKTNSIGIIQPDISNLYFARLVKSIEDVCQSKDFTILLSNTYEDYNKEYKLIKNMLDRGVDGFILVPADINKLDVKIFKYYDVPIILIGRMEKSATINTVLGNDRKGGYLATEHLIRRGHKNIIYMGAPLSYNYSRDRLRGYKEALTDYNRPFLKDSVVLLENSSMESGYIAMKSIIEQKGKITAVFAVNDLVAYGCLRALQEKKIKIPKDISIIGYDDIEMNVFITPKLTSVYQPVNLIGIKAVELLIEAINDKKQPNPQTILFDPEIRIREST